MRSTKVVGVFPRSAKVARAQLFNALGLAFAIEFEGRDEGQWRGLDGAIVFSPDEALADGPPCPSLVAVADDCAARTRFAVHLADQPALDRRLRGQTLTEQGTGAFRRLRPGEGDIVLAASPEGPLWLLRGRGAQHHLVAAIPDELQGSEVLRDHFRPGRFLGLLPLIHFLRGVQRNFVWEAPPLRAAFVFDDPNLHSQSYGYLKLPEVVSRAARHGYHVVLASVPLDYRVFDPDVVRMFREHTGLVSLAIHGNNHDHMELLRADSDRRALSIVSQALRRTATFETRSGLSVSRVMCAPHEVCSPAAMRAMFRLGFDAISMGRSFRTVTGPSLAPDLLAGWQAGQFVVGGFAILPRYSLSRPAEDLVLRAYLDLPLILYGHHGDVAGGLDVLDEAAARINALGQVQWLSLGDICRTNFACQRQGSTLRIRPYARRVSVPVPEGTTDLVIELPDASVRAGEPLVIVTDGVPISPTILRPDAISVAGPFPDKVLVELCASDALDAEQVPPPSWHLWPILRRRLTETRDRTAPMRGRLRDIRGSVRVRNNTTP